MMIKAQMRHICHLVLLLILVTNMAACNTELSSTSADSNENALAPTGSVAASAKPAKVTVPAGTRLRIALIDGVSTTNSAPGDQFMASLSEPVIVSGKMVLEKGTVVRGRVVDVKKSGRVKGLASIELALSEIIPNGKPVIISTKPFTAVAESTKMRDAGTIAAGAGIGTAIGAIAGGKKGAAVGAVVGGGAGTGTVLATEGKELHYPPETRLSFSLAIPVDI